jgi:formamidopyrimidine-DNA glycosylase
MPELPEVETVRRGLEPFIAGATFRAVLPRRPDLRLPLPPDFSRALTGHRIEELSRRAKYLLFHLDDGRILVSHLGMSGSYRIVAGDEAGIPGDFLRARSKDAAHDHVVFDLVGPAGQPLRLIYNDPRRFGFMLLVEEGGLADHPAFARLGVEPTGNSLDGRLLARLLAGRRAPLKAALMDQRLVAGLGNIYACEALWRARLDPRRDAGSIALRPGRPSAAAGHLADAIREVIAEAIASGGSSLRDFMHADGSSGYFQHAFSVYDREGEPCPRTGCRGVIERIVQSGRSTFFCPACQR